MKKECTWILRAMTAASLAGVVLVCAVGCTSRAITVTSLPPGAEVSINRRVVGKTPVRVNYTHYGNYRIELRQDRYKTLVRNENLRPPWYGYDPFSFFADNVIPGRINDESYLHYVMEPVPEVTDRDALMKRATAARDGKIQHPLTQKEVDLAWGPPPPKPGKTDLGTPGGPAATEVDLPTITGPAPTANLELPAELKAPKGITEKPPEAASAKPSDKPATATEKPATTHVTTPVTPTVTTEKPPAGPTAPATEKPATTPATTTTATTEVPPKKPEQPPLPVKRIRRTPQGELLIYDEPVIEDPGKKK